jgi:hypothetical protein
MQGQAPTAYGLLGIGLIGFLLVFFGAAVASEQGVVLGPGEYAILLAPLSPLALMVFGWLEGVTFEVNPQAWFLMQPYAGSRVRVYYVPGYKWIVNMEPMQCL